MIPETGEHSGGGSHAADDSGGDDADELLPAAIEVVVETGMASVSMLQRRLKLGYSRAARLVDQMEERKIVGPFEGLKAPPGADLQRGVGADQAPAGRFRRPSGVEIEADEPPPPWP